MKTKRIFLSMIAIFVILCFCGCAVSVPGAEGTQTPVTATVTETVALDTRDLFSARDTDPSYDEQTACHITLADGNIVSDSTTSRVAGNTVTITGEGTYVITGSLSDGQVVVDATSTAKVHLVLNGVSVTASSTAPLYIKQADKVFVTLADATQNALSVTGDFQAIDDNNIDAAIFSKDDLTINGGGALTVSCAAGHGVVSKDDLVIAGGTLSVTAAKHALSGKDSVRIANGTLTLNAAKDGIHAENNDDVTLGFVYIAGGTLTIAADGDGIDGASTVQIDGGTLAITAGGGAQNAAAQTNDAFRGFPGEKTTTTEEESASTKGVKASGTLIVNDGTLSVNAADDALHSNGNAALNGGTLSLTTGDDGIHADGNLTVAGGSIDVVESYEGIEGLTIDITAGNIHIQASDDGLNAAGGNDQSGFGGMKNEMQAVEGVYIRIAGGTLYVNAAGDGIDSNGSLTVEGGTVTVDGPENSGNGALDYNGTATITGGTLIAVGASGMAQNFGSASTQGAMLVNLSGNMVSGKLTLADSDGKTIITYTPQKTYNSILISVPAIQKGKTYTLTAGGSTQTVEMTSLIYGVSSGFGGGPMQQPGGQKQRPDAESGATTDIESGATTSLEPGATTDGRQQRPDNMTPPGGGQQGQRPDKQKPGNDSKVSNA